MAASEVTDWLSSVVPDFPPARPACRLRRAFCWRERLMPVTPSLGAPHFGGSLPLACPIQYGQLQPRCPIRDGFYRTARFLWPLPDGRAGRESVRHHNYGCPLLCLHARVTRTPSTRLSTNCR